MKRPFALAVPLATVATIGCSASPDQGAPLVQNEARFELACPYELNTESVEKQAVSSSCCSSSSSVDQNVEASYPAIQRSCGTYGTSTWLAAITPDGSGLAFYGPSIGKSSCRQTIVGATGGTVSTTDPCGAPSGSPTLTLYHCNGYPGSGCGSCGHPSG
jgi:hypothetical protein